MSRSLWKGNISFGLVTIPVAVVSAENKEEEIDFDLIDRRDHARIGYQKINKSTGKPVESEDIVKGLRLDSGKYAVFEQAELNALKIKGTRNIDIQQFVEHGEVDPIFFKKTYYLEPVKNGEKTYVLLREALKSTNKYAVGLIVLHNKQQLVLIGVRDDAMVMHTIHYAKEIKSVSALDLIPRHGKVKVTPKEVSMAERLIDELSSPWKPLEYKDTYVKQINDAVKSKARKKVSVEEPSEDAREGRGASQNILDLMPLLEKSLHSKKKSRAKSPGRRVARA